MNKIIVDKDEFDYSILIKDTKLYKLVGASLDLNDYFDKKEYDEFIKRMNYLHDDKIFTELVKPIDLLECRDGDRVTQGYNMNYLENYTNLENAFENLSLQDKLMYLNKISNVLKKIKVGHMIYDDIHDHNIMINHSLKDIKFIDADSVKITNFMTDEEVLEKEVKEKNKYAQMAMSKIYDLDLEDDYYNRLYDRMLNCELSHDLREHLKNLKEEINPFGYATDFKEDFEIDKIIYNKKVLTR